MKVPIDQVSNPTFVDELGYLILKCLDLGVGGVYLATGPESVSRYDYAVKISEVFGLNKNLIKPVKTQDLNQVAKRPLNNSTHPYLIQKITGFSFRNIFDSLAYLKKVE